MTIEAPDNFDLASRPAIHMDLGVAARAAITALDTGEPIPAEVSETLAHHAADRDLDIETMLWAERTRPSTETSA